MAVRRTKCMFQRKQYGRWEYGTLVEGKRKRVVDKEGETVEIVHAYVKYIISTRSCNNCKFWREYKRIKCKKKQPEQQSLYGANRCKEWG